MITNIEEMDRLLDAQHDEVVAMLTEARAQRALQSSSGEGSVVRAGLRKAH